MISSFLDVLMNILFTRFTYSPSTRKNRSSYEVELARNVSDVGCESPRKLANAVAAIRINLNLTAASSRKNKLLEIVLLCRLFPRSFSSLPLPPQAIDKVSKSSLRYLHTY